MHRELCADAPLETTMRSLNAIAIVAALLVAMAPLAATADESQLAGVWVLNYEETDKVAIEYKDGNAFSGGRFSGNVSVMGVPLPGGGGGPPRQSSQVAFDPLVLRCQQMQINFAERAATVACPDVGNETMRQGHYRGRDTSWSKRTMQQRYKTTERKVTKTWQIRADGRLFVEVVINPKGDKKKKHRRVFDRAAEAPEPTEAS